MVPASSAVVSNGVFEGSDWAWRILDCWESAETVNLADADALVADKSACTWSGVFDDRTRGFPSRLIGVCLVMAVTTVAKFSFRKLPALRNC